MSESLCACFFVKSFFFRAQTPLPHLVLRLQLPLQTVLPRLDFSRLVGTNRLYELLLRGGERGISAQSKRGISLVWTCLHAIL